MHSVKQTDTFLRFFLKLWILTMVFTFLLVFFFGEHEKSIYTDHDHTMYVDKKGTSIPRNTVDSKKTEVDILLQDIVEKELIGEHSSADIDRTQLLYNQICSTYSNICEKTIREWTYTLDETLKYQALIVYLLNHKQTWLSTTDIADRLSYIKLYQDDAWRRWSAGHKHIRMNTQKITSPKEFRQVLTHELGHVIDFSIVKWSATQKNIVFTEFGKEQRSIDDPSLAYYALSWIDENTRKKWMTEKEFVSGYAMKWIYEDIAESTNLRFNHNEYFHNLAKENPILMEKYKYFSELYHNTYYHTSMSTSTPREDERAWDTTRLDR